MLKVSLDFYYILHPSHISGYLRQVAVYDFAPLSYHATGTITQIPTQSHCIDTELAYPKNATVQVK